jgi:hypothetical protein
VIKAAGSPPAALFFCEEIELVLCDPDVQRAAPDLVQSFRRQPEGGFTFHVQYLRGAGA